MATMLAAASHLTPDEWRIETPFTPEMETATTAIANAASADEAAAVLAQWISRYQPCLFGRIAAKRDLLSFCVLDEEDLAKGDDAVISRIQECRLRWTADTFRGTKSGFVILLRSDRIARSQPNESLLTLARSLARAYLLEDIENNTIYSEEAFLESPGSPPRAWKWLAGVNFFGAQGDLRWWHDHRIPGGIALSVNSVGHMVKSGTLQQAMRALDKELEIEGQEGRPPLVDSLPKALEMAMRTIALAAPTPWGAATELLEVGADEKASLPGCPIELPVFLSGKNHCSYQGWYHTDQTLPAEYFLPQPDRPSGAKRHTLDFTYLSYESAANLDHRRLGKGVRIRAGEEQEDSIRKRTRTAGIEIDVDSSARLRAALGR